MKKCHGWVVRAMTILFTGAMAMAAMDVEKSTRLKPMTVEPIEQLSLIVLSRNIRWCPTRAARWLPNKKDRRRRIRAPLIEQRKAIKIWKYMFWTQNVWSWRSWQSVTEIEVAETCRLQSPGESLLLDRKYMPLWCLGILYFVFHSRIWIVWAKALVKNHDRESLGVNPVIEKDR